MKHFGRKVALAAGALTLAGSAAGAQAAGSGIPIRKSEMPAPASTASAAAPMRTWSYTYSGGDVTNLTGWNDGNVIAHMIAGDSLEVELGNMALAKSQNAQIRAAAQRLVTEHGASLAKLKEMTTSENIPPVPHPNDHGDDHLIAAINELRGLSGEAFDRAWLRSQISHHEMHLKMVEGLEDVSKDDDLEDFVEESYTPVKNHLEVLNSIATTWGMTPGVVTPKM